MVTVVTGNKNKQIEISKQIKNAKFVDLDLKEVYSDYITIIVYKIKETLKHIKISENEILMVEDVTMFVNGKFYPDIKWKQKNLKENDKVLLLLSIGKFQNGKIEVFSKKINGTIHFGICDDFSFGFDNIMIVNDKICLGHYKEKNPLRKLFKEVLNSKLSPEFSINIKNVKSWNGKYQND